MSGGSSFPWVIFHLLAFAPHTDLLRVPTGLRSVRGLLWDSHLPSDPPVLISDTPPHRLAPSRLFFSKHRTHLRHMVSLSGPQTASHPEGIYVGRIMAARLGPTFLFSLKDQSFVPALQGGNRFDSCKYL